MTSRWLLLLCLAGAAAGQDNEDSLDAETLAQDLGAARRVAKVLPPGDVTVKELLAKLGVEIDETDDIEGRRDLGCGGVWMQGWIGGGYGEFSVTVVGYEDRIAALEVLVRRLDPEDKAFEAKLRPILGAGFRRERLSEYDCLRYRFANESVQARFAAAIAAKLGKPEEVKVPGELRTAYEKLTDPLALLEYGWRAGEGADPARGRQEIEKILNAGDVPLLRNVARGPNPEGRIYAAEALLRLERKGRKLSESESKLIDAIRALSVRITCADGCIFGRKPGAEALTSGLKDAEQVEQYQGK